MSQAAGAGPGPQLYDLHWMVSLRVAQRTRLFLVTDYCGGSSTEGLHFTAGQARRMREAWDMFRDPKTRQIPEYSQAPLPVMSRNESRQLMDLWMEREPRSWRKIRFSVPFNFTGTGNETKLVELPRLGKPGNSLQRNP